MSRSNPVLLLAAVCVLPLAAQAAVKLTLTPVETPIRLTETGEFTAVVTGTAGKTVKLQVCDGFGAYCVTGGSSTLGTIAQTGTDASNNPIGLYTAPASLPPTLACRSVVLGCEVKVRAVLKFTKRGRRKKLKRTATVVLAAPGVIRRASLASDGTQANASSPRGSTGANGRFVAFLSFADNLVPGDTNGVADVFWRDTCLGVSDSCTPSTVRVSVASDGTEANNLSDGFVSISADGRYVTFMSHATNLLPDDTNLVSDVFVRDTCTGAGAGCTPSTVRASVASDGSQAGNFVNCAGSFSPVISASGRYVAFRSCASNLVGGDTNGVPDIFVRDTCVGVPTGCTPSTTRVSVANDGSEADGSSGANNIGRPGASISADGRFVAFQSEATNLVANDTNGAVDVFVRGTCAGASGPCTPSTTRVSVASDGTEGNSSSPGSLPAMSADGRFVAFMSFADNLLPGDPGGETKVLLRDTCAGAAACTPSTIAISVASDGTPRAGALPSISADGRFVVFESNASNLVTGDTNSSIDIFVRDTCTGVAGCAALTARVSVAGDGSEGNGPSFEASMSPDGRFVGFSTAATNLESDDTNVADDIYLGRTSFVRPPLAYVAGVNPNEVWVIDTGSNTVVGGVPVADDTTLVDLTPDGLRAYVTSELAGTVTVINTLSNTVVTTFSVGTDPAFVVVTPDGTRAYVVNQGSNDISVVDTGSNTIAVTVPICATPLGFIFKADGTRAYVACFGSNVVKILDTDPGSGTYHTVLATITVGNSPGGLALSPDGTRLYVGNVASNTVSVVNTSTNGVIATIGVGTEPAALAVTPDGMRVYVPNVQSSSVSVINTATNSVIATIAVNTKPNVVAIAPEGPTVYVTHDSQAVGAVTVISAASNTVVGTIPLAGAHSGIALRLVR